MSLEGANFTMSDSSHSGREVYEDVPIDQDIVKKLEMEFSTSQLPTQDKDGTSIDFDPKKDHMRVFLRIRPFSDDEVNKGENQKCIDVVNDNTIVAHAPKDSHTFKNSVHGNTKASNKFTFSKIFREDTSQKDFFDSAMLGTVKDFVDGQNCLVFTYGVTNSGKTYTIQGVPHDVGILPRALDVLFNSISGKQIEDMSIKPQMFCDVVRLSPAEIDKEVALKETTLKMATSEESDVTGVSSVGDSSDVSGLTVNSTTTNLTSISSLSEDSLTSSRMSTLSTTSTAKPSLDRLSKDSLDTMMEEAENRVREEGAINVDFQGHIKFGVWVSFAEIYNEQIFDLLEPPPKKKKAKRGVLHLREDKNGIPYVKGLREICVKSADEAYQILNVGKKNLQFACTKLNHNSSRSHCIFTVKLLRVVDKDNPHMARMSMLSLCDLAGSERYSKTQGQGDRIKEASNINTSLLTLGRCIKTLRHNQLNKDQQRIVPFRDSKLTRVFQSFFCGKGRASMVVNINQLASLFDETLHALKYSAIAKEVIVIQEEEEKKPPPAKKRGVVSMAFKQMTRDRGTIGWGTPGTIARVIEEEEGQGGSKLPLPTAAEDQDFDDLDETTVQDSRVASLLEVVEHLKSQLISARKQKMEMEMQIRDEVCREMAQQLVEIESQYSERIKEAQFLAEEKAEKKIELLTMSMKKNKKRKRFMEQDDDEEYVSSLLLHQEQVKVQERDVQIANLKETVSKLEKTNKGFSEERESLMEKISKLKFENTHLNEKIEQFSSEVEEQAQLFKEKLDQMSQFEQRIHDRDARIAELEQMIQSKGTQEAADSPLHLHPPSSSVRGGGGKDYLCSKAMVVSVVEESPSLLSPSLYDHTTTDVQASLEKQLPSSKIRTNPFVSNKRRSGGTPSGLNSSLSADSPEIYRLPPSKKNQDFNFNAMYGGGGQAPDSRSSSPMLFKATAGQTYTVTSSGKTSETYVAVKSQADSTDMAKTDPSTSPDRGKTATSGKMEVSSGIGSSVSCDSVNTTENTTSRLYIPQYKVISPSGSVKKLPRYKSTPSKYTPRRFQKNRDPSKNQQKSPAIQVTKNVRASLSEVEIVGNMTGAFSPPLSSTHRHNSIDPSMSFAPPLCSTQHFPRSLGVGASTTLVDDTFTQFSKDKTCNLGDSPDKSVTCSPFSSVLLGGEKRSVLKQLQNICTPKFNKKNSVSHPTSPFLDVLNDESPSPVQAIQTKEINRKNNHQMTVRLNKASRLRLLSPSVGQPPKNKRRKINLTQSSLFEEDNAPTAPPPQPNTRPKRLVTRTQKANVGKIAKRRKSGISIRGIKSIISRQLK